MTHYVSNFDKTEPFSDTTAQLALAASTALTYTVPGDSSKAYVCEFSWAYNSSIWVGYNVTATIPGAGTIASNANIELRPDRRFVRGGDVLSFISDSLVTNAGLRLLEIP